MKLSYNEFHISKEIRDLCKFDQGLFASSGNVVFANMKNVRAFALLLNAEIKKRGNEKLQVSAGQLNAMGLIDEIFHYVCMLYRRDKIATFMQDVLNQLDKEYTAQSVDEMLYEFMAEFPPVEVYQGKMTAQDYLKATALDAGTGLERSNREQTLEELILLHLANENPAFKPFLILFSDKNLKKNPLYAKSWKTIQSYALTQPKFGPFNHDLITLLREPVMFAPDTLKGQLEYIQKHWAEFLGEWIKRLLAGMDTISEEEKAAWQPIGFGDPMGGPDMQPFSYDDLMKEYERYSPDRDWMPKVVLMAKTVLVWLDQLTKQYGYPITRLDQIPDPELDKLRDEGFTGLWLIGLWERSSASKRIKQKCGNPEAAASAYSLYDYNIAQNIGGWDALANLRQRLWARGIRLASDMVPNHTGMDSDWVMNKPDLFIQRRDNPFPQYTFNGENLSHDSRTSIYLEDHYYSKNDCAVVFKRVDNLTGDVRYIYHGNDGTGLPWNDTAQIDFLNPAAREEVIQEILHVARNFPIIRFDAAMVLAKKHIRRLWYPEPGHGGDIATRSETGLSSQQFNDAIPNEFWREVVDRVAQEVPDTLLLAEAFWMMEGYFVRTLGMHRVYNSAFMNMLKKEENEKYRQTVKNTITFDPQVLKRYVNFMNNPDEETAVAQFGNGDKYFGVCTLMVTMPGLPMFGHGQIEGYTEKYGMEYTKAYKDEQPNQYLIDRHWHDIFPLMKKRYVFANVENFLFYDLWENGHVNENVFAYSNGCGGEYAVVFYNNKYERASGWIKQSCPYAVKVGSGENDIQMRSRSISEGLGLTAEDDKYCIFQEHRSRLWYIRKSSEICEKGLFVGLNGFEYQVLMNVHQVTDFADHRYKILCEFLGGKGCEDIEIAWQELFYKELYASFNELSDVLLKPLCEIFGFGLEETEKSSKKASKNNSEEKSEAKLKALLSKSKAYVIDFYTVALKFVDAENAVAPEKQYLEFTKRIRKLYEIHSEKAPKKPADLYKALLKCKNESSFAKFFISESKEIELALICWAIAAGYSETGYAKEWSLGRKFDEALRRNKIVEENQNYRALLTKLFVLASVSNVSVTEKEMVKSAYKVVSLLVDSDYAYMLAGANTFDNIKWFNKETTDYSLAVLIMLFALTGKQSYEQVCEFYKLLANAKLKAAYKCNLFLKPFAPKVKKPAAVKKTLAKDAKSSKTANAVNATKKSDAKTSKKNGGTKVTSKKTSK